MPDFVKLTSDLRGFVHSTIDNCVIYWQLGAVAENDDNELEQKRNQGKKVVYGQVVQVICLFLMHMSSKKSVRC